MKRLNEKVYDTGGPGRSNMPLSADVTSLTFVKYESERTKDPLLLPFV